MAAGIMLEFSLTTSFILGVALSITAEGTNLAILLQLKKLKSRVGSIIISAGMLNDIFGVIALSFILVLAHKSGLDSLALFPIKILAFIGIVWIASKVIPFALRHFEKKRKEVAMFNAVILVALIMAILSESLGLSSIVGAFVAGIILQNSFELRRDEKHEEHEMETLVFGFIIPFFFIHIALNLDYRSIIDYPILIFIVLIIAMFGKVIGVLLAKPFSNLKWGQLLLIGWEMNSRGIIELIIANVALGAGLISTPLYSAIVLTAILTTLISPFIIKGILSKHPRIMR
jgi:Kef-type K+ transport system membrane component KefB